MFHIHSFDGVRLTIPLESMPQVKIGAINKNQPSRKSLTAALIFIVTAGTSCAVTAGTPAGEESAPGKFVNAFRDRYSDPRVTCRETKVHGIYACSVWDGKYANEDPIIPRRYLLTKNMTVFESQDNTIKDALADIRFTAETELDAVSVAYLTGHTVSNGTVMDQDPVHYAIKGLPAKVQSGIRRPAAVKTGGGFTATVYTLNVDNLRALFRRGTAVTYIQKVTVTIAGSDISVNRVTVWKDGKLEWED